MFCTLWTFCGMPALSVPVGVQLVGRVGDDARLLRTARWLIAAGMAAYEYIESLRKEDE